MGLKCTSLCPLYEEIRVFSAWRSLGGRTDKVACGAVSVPQAAQLSLFWRTAGQATSFSVKS